MPGPGALPELLAPQFLKALEGLHLVARKLLTGTIRGERPVRHRGQGTQFLDHRKYSPGDDLRYVDWNIYGRLREPFVKEFEAEEGARVLLVLDRSASMAYGTPPKVEYARRIAAALGYIGLRHMDLVGLIPVPGMRGDWTFFRGPRQALEFFQALQGIGTGGAARLLSALRDGLRPDEKSGLAILISDFLDREGIEGTLRFLARHRYRVFCAHLVDRDEAAPRMEGEVRLHDLETGERLEVEADRALIRDYTAAFRRHSRRMEETCRRRGVGYVRLSTAVPFDAAVLRVLKRGGLAR